jgi:hypothetical protein
MVTTRQVSDGSDRVFFVFSMLRGSIGCIAYLALSMRGRAVIFGKAGFAGSRIFNLSDLRPASRVRAGYVPPI